MSEDLWQKMTLLYHASCVYRHVTYGLKAKKWHFEVVPRLDARNYAPDVEKYRAGDHRPCLISLLFLHPKESFPCLLVGFS